MDPRQELQALRRMAELEAKAGGMPSAPQAASPDARPPAMRHMQNLVGGAVRGAGSIGATLLTPYDLIAGNTKTIGNPERRAAMDQGMQSMGVDTDSMMYGGGKLVGEVAGTMGVGGGLANVIGRAAPAVAARAAPALDALRTAGMSSGGVTGARGVALRVGAGGTVGGVSAALVNPDDGGMGAGVGAVLPGMLQAAGKAGQAGAAFVRDRQTQIGPLAKALGVTEAEARRLVEVAQRSPDALVPGSKLTFSQALELAGENQPGVKMLERIVAGGPGGDTLLKRYADQGEARIAALAGQGARTYQGAAADTANRMGDKIGAVVRTQFADENAALAGQWQGVYKRGADDGVKLYLPQDEMKQAMKPLGRGAADRGALASKLMREADEIGNVQTEAIKATTDAASSRPLTLAQAVRRAGGLSLSRAEGLAGELRGLRGDAKNLVFNNGGKPPDRIAQLMHEAGYIESPDAKTLLSALKDDARMTPQFSNFDLPERQWAAARDAGMGQPPAAEAIPIPVPFDEFQRLRRSANTLGRQAAGKDNAAESTALDGIKAAITAKADAAAAGNLRPDEFMTPEFAAQYNAARGETFKFNDRYKGGNNIASILRKPAGQDYTLRGDQIFDKVWHGGGGLAGDVFNLKNVLSQNNFDPTMNALREGIMTEAASKTTAAGQFGAALPKYVEDRLPGLQEALKPEQLKALTSVADDIRNAAAASNVAGLMGSDTQAKIARALDAGLLDGAIMKFAAKWTTLKGIGIEPLRKMLADSMVQNKGAAMAEIFANRGGTNALMQGAQQPGPVRNALQNPELQQFMLRAAPVAQPWASR